MIKSKRARVSEVLFASSSVKYKPKTKTSWATKIISEFIGSIFLIWMIGLLGVYFEGRRFSEIISFGPSSSVVTGWWVALDVLICIVVLGRWSCDLNPAVTTYRLLSKGDSLVFGFAKIITQILGGLVAGLCLYATQQLAYNASGLASDLPTSFTNDWDAYLNSKDIMIGNHVIAKANSVELHFLMLFTEFVGTLMLLWPIFTKSIKKSVVNEVVLIFAIAGAVASFSEIGGVGLNPARSLGTNYIYDAVKGQTNAMEILWAHIVGPLIAAVALYQLQIFGASHLNHWWEKCMTLGKVKE